MISLRGLTDHTMKSYQTYISAYLDYIENTLCKTPSQVSYKDQRRFLEVLQRERNLSDRTINVAISQLRFFTLYVLHKPWDDTQLPMRKIDTYLPFVPTKEETKIFISTMTDIKPKAMVSLMYSSGLRIGEVCNLRYEDIQRKNMRIHITHGKNRSDRYVILSKQALDILTEYWFACGKPTGYLFLKQRDSSKHYLDTSPMNNVTISVKFRQVVKKTGKTETYDTEQLAQLNNYLDGIYAETGDSVFLAVKLNFMPGLRVGELVALKLGDIENDTVHVIREEVRDQTTNT